MDTDPAVEPHGAIEPLFEDVWRVVGSVMLAPLTRLSRTMVIVRTGASLTLINAVRVDDAGLAALDALGKVEHVVRIGTHGMDDGFYVRRYAAKLWALPGVRHARGLATDVDLAPDRLPIPDMKLFVFEHTKAPEAVLLLERHGGLLVCCDSVQHWEPMPFSTFLARVSAVLMGFRHPAQIGPIWRKAMTRKGDSLRPDFERLVALPFRHLIGGHGGLLRDEGPERLRDTITRTWGP